MRAVFAFLFDCATVSLAELASANVVGYQEQNAKSFWMMTPTFESINSTGYSIHDFVVKGASDGMTTMQILDGSGGVSKMAFWYNDGGEGYPAGWWDEEGAELVEHSLAPGEGVIVNSSEAGVKLVSSGQVPGVITKDIGVFVIFGNGSPVEISNHDISITGASDGMTTMQILDSAGAVSKMAFWYNDGGEGYPAGWWDEEGAELVDVTLAPGDAVILNSSEEGVKAKVPSALAD